MCSSDLTTPLEKKKGKHRKKKELERHKYKQNSERKESVNEGRTWKLGRKLRRLRAKYATKGVRETNRTEDGEMRNGKAKKSKGSALESAGKLKEFSLETRPPSQ